MKHRSVSWLGLAMAMSLIVVSSTSAAVQGDSSAAVLSAAKQVAGLVDRLAETGSVDEDQLYAAWRALHEVEAQLPPEVKGSEAGGGPPKGLMACDVMLANAQNYARMRERDAQRAHALTRAALQCYAQTLSSAGTAPKQPCTALAPTDLAPSHRVEMSHSIVAQYRPLEAQYEPPQHAPTIQCYRLQPGTYQSYKRGYDGQTLEPNRQVVIFIVSGRYQLLTPNGTYPMKQTKLVDNGAQYVMQAVKLPNQSTWQPLKPPVYATFVKQANIDSPETKYDLYFSNNLNVMGSLPSETWVLLQ